MKDSLRLSLIMYLKISRLIKRRAVANEACDAGRVMVNDKVAKASVDVKVGDVIEIAFGQKSVKVRVLDVHGYYKKMYKTLSTFDLYFILFCTF